MRGADMTNDVPDVEKMADFFDRRAASYEEHMRWSVAGFDDFYRNVAEPIGRTEEPIAVLDLGCGTGLELAFIFEKVLNAQITAVDLSQEMLAKLSEKYADKAGQIVLIQGSFLEFPIEQERWDYIVSVMAMHHLTPEEKLPLYHTIHKGLKPGGLYIEATMSSLRGKRRNSSRGIMVSGRETPMQQTEPTISTSRFARIRSSGFSQTQDS